jgi:hypothetical protein
MTLVSAATDVSRTQLAITNKLVNLIQEGNLTEGSFRDVIGLTVIYGRGLIMIHNN